MGEIRNGEWEKKVGACKNTQSTETQSPNNTQTTQNTNGADTEPPVITINGNNPANVEVGAAYADLGATVFDAGSPNIGVHTFGLEAIDTSTTTSYIITYTATDQAGNTATTTRQVIVHDTNTPNGNTPTEATSTPPIEPTTTEPVLEPAPESTPEPAPETEPTPEPTQTVETEQAPASTTEPAPEEL